MRKRIAAGDTGLSLMELTVMLSVLSVLTAAMAPSVVDYVADARRVKAAGDVPHNVPLANARAYFAAKAELGTRA